MDSPTYDICVLIDLFLLLLIAVGPKIALVPFLKATANLGRPDEGARDAQDAVHRRAAPSCGSARRI